MSPTPSRENQFPTPARVDQTERIAVAAEELRADQRRARAQPGVTDAVAALEDLAAKVDTLNANLAAIATKIDAHNTALVAILTTMHNNLVLLKNETAINL